MSRRIFKSNLSVDGITNLISQLQGYEDEIMVKAEMMVRLLADFGIRAAEYSVYDDYRPHIDFVYEPLSRDVDMVEGQLVGRDNSVIHRVWYTRLGAVSGEADVSPILMSEFGAGPYALNGHRGTFPNQRNAFKSEWFWYDVSGKRHSSEEDYHMIATQPMYHAFVEMMQKADHVARQVFGAGV